jgi:hypothetical protein
MFVPKKMARAKGTSLISTPKKKAGSIARSGLKNNCLTICAYLRKSAA